MLFTNCDAFWFFRLLINLFGFSLNFFYLSDFFSGVLSSSFSSSYLTLWVSKCFFFGLAWTESKLTFCMILSSLIVDYLFGLKFRLVVNRDWGFWERVENCGWILRASYVYFWTSNFLDFGNTHLSGENEEILFSILGNDGS